jgi:fumarylacetoacetate (FAA) hydrolase
MKLASLRHGRDGQLVVVSNDLTHYVKATPIARTLQEALDNWDYVGPRLQSLAEQLEHQSVPFERFHEREAAAPLPRAFQWADGSAYINHVELVRKARGAEVPESFYTDPLMYQGGSDGFLGARDPIGLIDPAFGLDFEGEVAVITGDVPMGVSREAALECVRLVMLVNDVSLRGLTAGELAKGFGFFQSKPASAFSPVAVTPEALGPAWRDGKLHGALLIEHNGAAFGRADAGADMTFDFGSLIAHAARTRHLCAGTIIGSGTVSNRGSDGGPGLPVKDGGHGYSCLAEVRVVEQIRQGAANTRFMAVGDTLRIEMKDAHGKSIFGAIEQVVIPA